MKIYLKREETIKKVPNKTQYVRIFVYLHNKANKKTLLT